LKALDKLEAQTDQLLFHNPLFTITDTELIHDQPRSTLPGYGFVDDEHNSWSGKMTVLEYILSTPEHFDRFAYRNDKGIIVWKPTACYTFMKDVYNLQMDIFIVIILTFGAPGRGSEMLAQLFRNIAGGTIRNIFALFNLFIMRGSYNKTSQATHGDKCMVRVPLPRVGRLCIRILAFLRPVFAEFQRIFRPRMHFNATYYFYAGLDRPLTTTDLTDHLASVFNTNFGIQMSIARFRQMMAFLMSCNQRCFPHLPVDTTPVHDQFGHNRNQSVTTYGPDDRFPDGLARDMYWATATTSASLQMVFGFPPDLLIAICAGHQRQNTIIELQRSIIDGKYVPSGQEVIVGTTGNWHGPSQAVTTKGLVEELKSSILPELHQHITRALAQSHAAVVDMLSPEQSFPHSLALVPSVQRFTHPFILQALRTFRNAKDEDTLGFTGTSQAEVTQLMYDGQKNIGYFAGTGLSFVSP
jgi:hypothetical protein